MHARFSSVGTSVSLPLFLGLALCQAEDAIASTFSVNPTRIQLKAGVTSQLLTLQNQSGQTLRFQLSVFRWDQDEKGEMQLSPTQDIVFFPSLLTLAPSEERRVRIGATTGFGASEKTYRLFVEELPPAEPRVGGVTVLTKMGIPIFMEPSQPVAQAQLAGVAVERGVLNVSVQNTGTVHFLTEAVRIKGLNKSGQVVLEQEVPGWYVLAGGLRTYTVSLPKPQCGSVASLEVDVQIDKSSLNERLMTPTAPCTP